MKESRGRGRPVGSTKKKDAKDTKIEKESKKKLAVKEKTTKRHKKKEKKAAKDPNLPKRPSTAFFVFLEDFRAKYKEDHPDVKGVAAVGKAAGDKWGTMTEDEKAVYVKKAAQRRADYDKSMAAYKKKQDDEEQEGSAEDSKENEEESAENEEEEDDDD